MWMLENPGDTLAMVAFVVFAGLLVIAAAWDVKNFTIPNGIPILLIVSYLLFATVMPNAFDWADSGLGLVVLGVTGIGLYHWRLVGGGDVKLMAAVGPWIGFKAISAFLLFVSISGAWLAIALLIGRYAVAAVRWMHGTTASGSLPRVLKCGAPVPYGVAIAAGALLAAMNFNPLSGLAS